MNRYLTIILISIIPFQSFGQDACTIFEQAQKLESKIGNGGAHYVKTYWAKRCACESGATATGSFESAVKIANINYDHYQDNKEWYKTNFNGSSSLLPNKRISVSDCKQGGNTQINSINYEDCQNQIISTDKDPQRFISTYMIAKCMCEKGVASKAENDKLFLQMQVAYDGYKTSYINSSIVLQNPKILKPCPIVKVGSNSNYIDPDNGILIKDEYLELINEIAVETKNPHFKNMAQKMNENKQLFQKNKDFINRYGGGLTQNDVDFYNGMENISQGVEIVKFIYNTATNQLTPEQEEGRKMIMDIFTELDCVYNEVKAVPTFYSFNDNTITRLSQIEKNIVKYENTTATRRLLYLNYWHTKPYMTVEEIESEFTTLQSLEQSMGTEHIKGLIKNKETSFNRNEFLHIINKEDGFKTSYNKIALSKAKYYKENGNTKKADQILKNIDYDINNFDAFKLLHENYKEKNYYGCFQYYEQVKEVLTVNENGSNFFYYYKNIPNIDYNGLDGLWRQDAVYLIGLGVLSYLSTGEIPQANIELEYLKWYNNNYKSYLGYYKSLKPKKRTIGLTVTELESGYNLCIAIEKTIEATLLAKKGEINKAELLISKAVILNENSHSSSNTYEHWFLLSQLDILIRTGNYVKAKKIAIRLKQESYNALLLNAKLFTQEDFRFLMVFLKYKEGNYNSALLNLNILEQEYPNSARIKQLKKNINTVIEIQNK